MHIHHWKSLLPLFLGHRFWTLTTELPAKNWHRGNVDLELLSNSDNHIAQFASQFHFVLPAFYWASNWKPTWHLSSANLEFPWQSQACHQKVSLVTRSCHQLRIPTSILSLGGSLERMLTPIIFFFFFLKLKKWIYQNRVQYLTYNINTYSIPKLTNE